MPFPPTPPPSQLLLRWPLSTLPLLAAALFAAASPGTAQDVADASAPCEGARWFEPESLQSHGALLATLPSLDEERPGPERTWRTAARLGRAPLCGEHPWLVGWTRGEPAGDGPRLLPATARLTLTSGWPVERNNGLQWAGKGLSGVVRAGWGFRSGRVSVELRPVVAWAENRPYAVYDTTLVDRDRQAYPWHARRIDWPQRHGDGAQLRVGSGESRVAVDLGRVEAALSSEQVAWGPSLAYPLLLGPSAPGFPHLSLSLTGPVALGGFGTVEAQLLWGALSESDHFDQDRENDRRLLSGLVVSLQPAVLPGFSVGAASLVHSAWSELGPGDLLGFLQVPFEGEDGDGNVDGNGLGSLFARWAVPGSGFEAWVEWARDDYSFTLEDLVAEPDHAQAWTVGFQQVGRLDRGLLRLSGELTHLTNDEPRTEAGRTRNATFYTHAGLPQGHTHRGQLLGAPVGPGSDAQTVRLDLLRDGRLWGLRLERVRWDDDAYVRNFGDRFGAEGHDVELTAGLRHARSAGALVVEVEGDVQIRRNRLFTELGGEDPDTGWEPQLRLETTVTWRPDGGR